MLPLKRRQKRSAEAGPKPWVIVNIYCLYTLIYSTRGAMSQSFAANKESLLSKGKIDSSTPFKSYTKAPLRQVPCPFLSFSESAPCRSILFSQKRQEKLKTPICESRSPNQKLPYLLITVNCKNFSAYSRLPSKNPASETAPSGVALILVP